MSKRTENKQVDEPYETTAEEVENINNATHLLITIDGKDIQHIYVNSNVEDLDEVIDRCQGGGHILSVTPLKKDPLKETEICDCECHKFGHHILHCFPCCDLSGRQYIEKDGKINTIEWAISFREVHKNMPTVKTKDGKTYWVHK